MGEYPSSKDIVGCEDSLKADGHPSSELSIIGEVCGVRVGVGDDELFLVGLGRVTRRVPSCRIGESAILED